MTEWFEWRDAPASARYAVLGDPISHSLSPRIHSAALGQSGLYVALRVPLGELRAAMSHLRGMGYQGVNVTVPLKTEALACCMQLNREAERTGAVNTIRLPELEGHNTDVRGFVGSLPQGHRAGRTLVLGTGGAAKAVVVGLLDSGGSVQVWSRRGPGAAIEFLSALGAADRLPNSDCTAKGFDTVVNCTSASMRRENLPVDWRGAEPHVLAVDLYYGTSPFLDEARAHGIETMDGLPMLLEQAAIAYEIWHGAPAPRAEMKRAIS